MSANTRAINPIYWDFKFIQDYMVVLENCKGVGSRMPVFGPVDCQKNKTHLIGLSCDQRRKKDQMTSKKLSYPYLTLYNKRE